MGNCVAMDLYFLQNCTAVHAANVDPYHHYTKTARHTGAFVKQLKEDNITDDLIVLLKQFDL